MRDVQEPSEPSTPIDKGIQSDLGGIAELEPEFCLHRVWKGCIFSFQELEEAIKVNKTQPK